MKNLYKIFIALALVAASSSAVYAHEEAEAPENCGDEVVSTCSELKAMWMD